MKNFFESRGQMQQIVYDPLTGTFGTRKVPHPFEAHGDPLTRHMLDDVGLGAEPLSQVPSKIAA